MLYTKGGIWWLLCACLFCLAIEVGRAQAVIAPTMDRSITSLNSSTTGGIATGPAVVVNGIPVNLYRGIASPTVALTSLASRELVTSVALAYDGQGVRVNSVASEVGTGWNLIAGGEIVCDVRDEPDQNRGRPLDWLRTLQTKPAGNGLERDYQEYVCRDGVKEYDDTEHDIFTGLTHLGYLRFSDRLC